MTASEAAGAAVTFEAPAGKRAAPRGASGRAGAEQTHLEDAGPQFAVRHPSRLGPLHLVSVDPPSELVIQPTKQLHQLNGDRNNHLALSYGLQAAFPGAELRCRLLTGESEDSCVVRTT